MNRRTFLISTAGFAMAGLLAVLKLGDFDKVIEVAGYRFIVDRSGQLLISRDGGARWDISLKLGPGLNIHAIDQANSEFRLLVHFGDHEFSLRSPDGNHWKTI